MAYRLLKGDDRSHENAEVMMTMSTMEPVHAADYPATGKRAQPGALAITPV
jgi:hypothetical protein